MLLHPLSSRLADLNPGRVQQKLAMAFEREGSGETGLNLGKAECGEYYELWLRAAAEWLFWQKAMNMELNQQNNQERFASERPFGPNSPTLRELLGYPVRAAVFPVAGGAAPVKYRIYVSRLRSSQGGDHRRFLCANHQIPDDVSVWLGHGQFGLLAQLDGSSWQLAFHLALRALREHGSADSPKHSQALALSWLITGACSDGEIVTAVDLKDKQTLCNDRRFMIPSQNLGRGDAVSLQKDFAIFPVKDVDGAWTHITAQGILPLTTDFPEQVDELHILVGKTIQHLLCVILMVKPKRVVLWHSAMEPFPEIAATICQCLSGRVECGCRQMSSDAINESYQVFYLALQESQSFRRQLLICNTGGNRMMGFAALLVAKNLGIPVVYRDIDAPRFQLEKVFTVDDSPILANGKCILRQEFRDAAVCWDMLFDGNWNEVGGDAEAIKAKIFLSTK